MQRYVNFLLFLFFCFPVYGQEGLIYSISPQAQISLVTCAPGEALFEAFGHSAIRVNDPVSGLDLAYNYGVFDFDQPNFYLNFIQGYLRYQLSVSEFERFLYQYTYFDRSVEEQVLELTYTQKLAIASFLQMNSLPENREYYYDYFFDNCATRPRDVFIHILGDSLQFDYGYADTLSYTIRGLTDRYLEGSDQYAWGDLGIDLGLGVQIDRLAKPFEYMYQPEFLALAFEGATIQQPDGSRLPLVAVSHTLYQESLVPEKEGYYYTPKVVFWILLLLLALATAFDFRRGKYSLLAFDLFFFTILGLIGCLLVYLWFFTNHTAASNNWNLLWTWPTHLTVFFLLLMGQPHRVVSIYFIVTAFVTGLILLFWQWIPQDLHESLIPVLLLIMLRSVAIFQVKLAHKIN